MLAASLTLEKELCKRRIKVIEFLEEHYSDDMDNYADWDHGYVRYWLSDFLDVISRDAFLKSLKKTCQFDIGTTAEADQE